MIGIMAKTLGQEALLPRLERKALSIERRFYEGCRSDVFWVIEVVEQDFTQSRADLLGEAGFTCVRAQGKEVVNQVVTMRDKFSHIVIDAGGQDNPSLRAGLAVSDKVLVPVSPRSFETWALENMAALIEEASITNPKLEAFAVLNLAFPRGSDNDQTQDIIREDYPKLALIEPNVVQRKVFSDAVGLGLSVLEAKPRNPDAIGEMLGLLSGLGINQNDIEVIYNGRAA